MQHHINPLRAATGLIGALAALGLAACSSGADGAPGFGDGGGGGPAIALNDFAIRGTDGVRGSSATPAVLDTTTSSPLAFEWDVDVNNGINDLYRVEGFLLSRSGSNAGEEREILGRNCNAGVNTGCDLGSNSFPCTFLPERSGIVLACPPGEGSTFETALAGFLSNSAGLPGTYDIRFEACTFVPGSGTSTLDEVCRERTVPVTLR